MAAAEPEVCVLIATRDRAERLRANLETLRAQTLAPERFEVIVVDDGSTDDTQDVLAAERRHGRLALHALAHRGAAGPAAVRNTGWPQSRAPLIAFTDDDCEADPRWLEALVTAWSGAADHALQGPTRPIAREQPAQTPFSYTYDIRELNLDFPTCNIAYPRALLERLGGFDESFGQASGEDTDLAWRAIESGCRIDFAEQALVHHAVVEVGPAGMLRRVWRWGDAMSAYARHARLRRERLYYRFFFNLSHWYLLRALVAICLPRGRALWPLRAWLAWPYLRQRRTAPWTGENGLRWLAWNAVVDGTEMLSVLQGSLRHGTLVL
jgi:glycosyltransferase involved in cell wall biosynthesis